MRHDEAVNKIMKKRAGRIRRVFFGKLRKQKILFDLDLKDLIAAGTCLDAHFLSPIRIYDLKSSRLTIQCHRLYLAGRRQRVADRELPAGRCVDTSDV